MKKKVLYFLRNIKKLNIYIWVVFISSFLVLSFLIYFMISLYGADTNGVNLFGYQIYSYDDHNITTELKGNVLFTKKFTQEKLRIDDYVVLNNDSYSEIYQIYGINNHSGKLFLSIKPVDNNNSIVVNYSDYVGTITYKSNILGYFLIFLKNPLYIFIFIMIPLTLLLGFAVFYLYNKNKRLVTMLNNKPVKGIKSSEIDPKLDIYYKKSNKSKLNEKSKLTNEKNLNNLINSQIEVPLNS